MNPIILQEALANHVGDRKEGEAHVFKTLCLAPLGLRDVCSTVPGFIPDVDSAPMEHRHCFNKGINPHFRALSCPCGLHQVTASPEHCSVSESKEAQWPKAVTPSLRPPLPGNFPTWGGDQYRPRKTLFRILPKRNF